MLLLCLFAWQAPAQDTLPQLVKKVQPAVVTVIVYDAKGKVKRLGSGFFIDPEGRFLTNYHVLKGMARAEVKTPQGRRLPVTGMVAQDQDGDLAIAAAGLRGERVPFLTFSRIKPEVGERVAVVGSPLGLEQTLSEGVVSAVRQIPSLGKVLQITAPTSSGSSGSPVVNMKGEVVGVATFQIVKGQNLNFAVPASRALALQQRLAGPSPRKPAGLAEVLYEQAVKSHKAGDDARAVLALEEAVRLRPDYAKAFIGLGTSYYFLGRYQEALLASKEAVRLQPNAHAQTVLGWVYEALGRYQEAIASYQEAIRLQPDSAPAHASLGLAYLSLGNRIAALEEYKVLQRLDPKMAEALFKKIYP